MGGPLKVLPEGKNKKLRIHFTFQNHKAIRKYAIDVFPFFQQQDITPQGTRRTRTGTRRRPYPSSHNSIPQNRGIKTIKPDHRGREKGIMSMKQTQKTTAKYNLSKEQEMELIQAIRQGDYDAENRLFESLYGFMKKTHEFGPDGITGRARKELSSNFENALADLEILEIFRKCVETYDPERGSFKTHLGYRLNMAAKDRVRNRTKSKGFDNPDTLVFVDTGSHECDEGDGQKGVINRFDALTADWAEAKAIEDEEHDLCFRAIDLIIEHFGEESIEGRYVELYCALGVDGKKHTAEICEALGCSRQTLSNIKKRIYDAFGGMWPMAA